jgi:hypothetical protein
MALETAPTQFVEAAGTRFAYRRLGPRDGTPFFCLQHFSERWTLGTPLS